MKIFVKISIILVVLGLISCSEKQEMKEETENMVEVKAIDLANFDESVNPGDDFFKYVNGKWMENNPIPDEESRWGAFNVLYEENQDKLHTMFETASQKTDAPKGTVEQQMGDLYSSGMDLDKINKLRYEPIKPHLDKIDAIASIEDLQNVVFDFSGEGLATIIGIYVGPDDMNSSMNIINFYQTGLNLPDKSYYLEDDERSKQIREAYTKHVSEMFTLVDVSEEEAAKHAENVLTIEKKLAESSKSRVELRDPVANYNAMELAQLNELSPTINWDKYFAALEIDDPGKFNVGQTKYYQELSNMMKDDHIEAWKSYLKYSMIKGAAPYLSQDFVNANFDFYGKELSGKQALKDRWKRVVSAVNGTIGEAVGKLYVEKYFPPRAKERMLDLVANLKTALEQRIQKLDWMTEETKEKALTKLSTMNVKIGYPDQWRDYSDLNISRDSYLQNMLNASKFEYKYNLSKIGKPVDEHEWHMPPQTVNAYYSPNMNEIVFPAGILQPPFFFMNADDAVNYGGIGVVIGHEITHGFDDQGRQFDADGNLKDWWQEKDAEQFNQKAKVIVDQYNNFEVLPGKTVNGELTLGENIADFGGLTLSLQALRMAQPDLEAPKIDGFTPKQRFFISYAQIWRQNIREKELMKRLKEDVHSPASARVNAGVVNIPEFYDAFPIQPENDLFIEPEMRASIW